MKCVYFVYYHGYDAYDCKVHGRCEIARDAMVVSIQGVAQMECAIEDMTGRRGVMIHHYQLMRVED